MTLRNCRNRAVGTGAILLCLCFLAFSDTAYDAALNAGTLVFKTVIPILIPYTVLSCVISDTISEEKGITAIMAAFFIGNLCGAPIGAIQVAKLYDKGAITKKEAGALLPAVSCASPAFCINAVGWKLFEDRWFGILVWITQLVINLSLLAILLVNRRKTKCTPNNACEFGIDFADAIKRASSALCSVAISVIFFSALSATLGDLLRLGKAGACAINSFFEMSGGCRLAGELSSPLSYTLASFALGFGGISVLTQVSAAASNVPKARYVITKLISGGVCAVTSAINSPNFLTAIENLTK